MALPAAIRKKQQKHVRIMNNQTVVLNKTSVTKRTDAAVESSNSNEEIGSKQSAGPSNVSTNASVSTIQVLNRYNNHSVSMVYCPTDEDCANEIQQDDLMNPASPNLFFRSHSSSLSPPSSSRASINPLLPRPLSATIPGRTQEGVVLQQQQLNKDVTIELSKATNLNTIDTSVQDSLADEDEHFSANNDHVTFDHEDINENEEHLLKTNSSIVNNRRSIRERREPKRGYSPDENLMPANRSNRKKRKKQLN